MGKPERNGSVRAITFMAKFGLVCSSKAPGSTSRSPRTMPLRFWAVSVRTLVTYSSAICSNLRANACCSAKDPVPFSG